MKKENKIRPKTPKVFFPHIRKLKKNKENDPKNKIKRLLKINNSWGFVVNIPTKFKKDRDYEIKKIEIRITKNEEK